MNAAPDGGHDPARELVLERLLDAPRASIWRAWTDPEQVVKWFAPKPWSVARAELDVRPGGTSLIVMRSPEGQEFPGRGVYLEVVENERLVFTDAYVSAWVPSEKPFFTGVITLADEGGKTRYIARALHWTVADCEAHERMGFHDGWGKCAEQLEALARTI